MKYSVIVILLLPILTCGYFSTQSEPRREPTPVKLVRFNTPTPSATPTPTPHPPTVVTATTLPTGTPTPTATPVESQGDSLPTATLEPTLLLPTPTPAPAIAVPPTLQPSDLPTLQPSSSSPHLGYGVQLAEAKNMELAVKGGFTWAKHDLNLRKDTNYTANADNLLSDLLGKYGTKNVLLKLIVWSEGGLPDAPRTPDEVTTFASNAATVAEFVRNRYGGMYGTIAYEVWNEPNLNYEWESNPNPAEYVTLLRATSDAIRQADPDAWIISGAPSPGGDFDDLKFLEGMYANGAKGLMDAVGSHPYGGPWPYDRPNGTDEAGNGWPYFRKVEAQRAIMEKYGDLETQIWATEFSWLAGIPNCNFGEHTRWQVTPQQQADYLVAAYQYADQNWPWMGPMFVVYDFAISGRYDRCHPASGYSILRPDSTSPEIMSLAAQALFAMPKNSAW
ncbi:MAG: cellulase family glycosylhydrolase [Anaerolineae bacterium]|nr:cellulase family glycosylhydrolase [Anaerolineae bacterium]